VNAASLFLLLLLFSCGTVFKKAPRQGKTVFSYSDVSGQYGLVREVKLLKNKLITRSQITASVGNSSKILEKTITVSQLGSIKENTKRLVTLRPQASEFTVWLEGKRFFSKMQLNPETKKMDITLENPELKTGSVQSVPFPKGRYFCFYSQVPDCLYHNSYLTRAQDTPNHPFEFYIVWDNYPYIQDQLSNVGKNLFAPATIKFEGFYKNLLRYVLEVEGQIILYHFTKSYDLVKMSWIAQGITVLPPGEEASSFGDE
jgi:hypothetical protein